MIEINNILDVEKHLDGIDAVIFDLDDTLYSEKDYVHSGFNAVADHFSDPPLAEKLWDVFERGGKAFDEVFEALGMLEKKDEALHIYRYHRPEIELYPGVSEMIARIKTKKKVGIITDGRPEGQRAKIEALGLKNLVDEIIITDELGGVEFRKPCARAFQLMQKTFDILYEQTAYIGDNPSKDFDAPVTLGIKTVYFKNTHGLFFNHK